MPTITATRFAVDLRGKASGNPGVSGVPPSSAAVGISESMCTLPSPVISAPAAKTQLPPSAVIQGFGAVPVFGEVVS